MNCKSSQDIKMCVGECFKRSGVKAIVIALIRKSKLFGGIWTFEWFLSIV